METYELISVYVCKSHEHLWTTYYRLKYYVKMSRNLGVIKPEPASPTLTRPASPAARPSVSPPRGNYKSENMDELTNIPMVEIHPGGDPMTMLDWTGMLRRACNIRVMIRKDGTLTIVTISWLKNCIQRNMGMNRMFHCFCIQ